MATYILNKKDATKIKLDPSDYNVMIRITNPKTDFLQLENENIFTDILSLKFFDLEDDKSGLYLFNETHLERIMQFFNKHRNCKNMVIHCDEGKSRSAGVAVGWFLFNDIKSSIYKIYHNNIHFPNRRIVEFFYKHFNENLNNIDKWENELYS